MPQNSMIFSKNHHRLFYTLMLISSLYSCRMPADDDTADQQVNTEDLALIDMRISQDMRVMITSDMQASDMQASDMQLEDMQLEDMQLEDMSIPLCETYPIGISTRYESPLAITSEETLAQTLTIPFSGILSALRLPSACEADSRMRISIKPINDQGQPDLSAIDLSTTEVGSDVLPSVLNTTTTVQIQPLAVTAGQKIAVVFSLVSGISCGIAQTPGLDYEGAQGYYTGAIGSSDRWESLCPPLAQGCDLPIAFLFTPEGSSLGCMPSSALEENPCQPSSFPFDLDGAANTPVIGGASYQELAQVFESQEDQNLLTVMLPMGCAMDSLAKVEIQRVTDGVPNGHILSSQITIPEQVNVPLGSPVVIQIPAVRLGRGDQFAVVLKIDSSRSTATDPSCALKPLSTNAIDAGDAYYKGLPGPLTTWNRLCQLPTEICDLPIHLSFGPPSSLSCPFAQSLNTIDAPRLEIDPAISFPEGEGSSDLEDEQGQIRKVVAMTSDHIELSKFVEYEVILNIDRPETLDAFLSKYPGTVVSQVNFSEIDLSKLDDQLIQQGLDGQLRQGIMSLGTQVLIKLDEQQTSLDLINLSKNLRLIDPLSRGTVFVSNEQAFKTLALSIQAKVEGFDIAVNWLIEKEGIRQKQTLEASSNAHGNRANGFEWDILKRGGIFNTGIADSWRALLLEDRLRPNTIGVGIIDGGFVGTHQDYPSNMTFISNIPFVSDIRDRQNGTSCGGNTCLWHGTGSALSAFAQVDNNYGGAGPAGPVANGIVTHSAVDLASVLPAVIRTIGQGARVVNMSFTARIPASVSFVVIPFERLTSALSNTILFVASAGNQNSNVDEEDCFGICWESRFVSPCENDGVYCIGATAMNSMDKASYSNYGNHRDRATVDIYAPGSILVGLRSVNNDLMPLVAGDNYADYFTGTSAASPFAAGSFALLWTIQPHLSPRALMNAIMPYFVDGTDGNVVNFIQIYEAAIGLLGFVPNEPPSIIDVSSSLGLNIPLNVSNHFVAITSDLEDAISCCDVEFRSNIEGVIGMGRSISYAFQSVGRHQITAIARDSQGRLSDPYVFEIDVVNQAPVIEILRPVQGYTGYQNIGFRVTVRATDINEASPFACDRIRWQIENQAMGERIDLLNLGADCSANVFLNQLGARTLLFESTDLQGLTGSTSLQVNVIQRPSNLPPRGQIDLPLDGAHFDYPDQPIRISGTALDPEGDPLYITWFASWAGGIGIGGPILAVDELSFDWTPLQDGLDCSLGIFIPVRVDLVLSDGNTVVEADQVTFYMDCPPM